MKFSFSINHVLQFRGCLACERCQGKTKGGSQCSRKTCIGTGWCHTHLLNEKHLRIQMSTIPYAGKGLFAMDKTKPANAIIFRTGTEIDRI